MYTFLGVKRRYSIVKEYTLNKYSRQLCLFNYVYKHRVYNIKTKKEND